MADTFETAQDAEDVFYDAFEEANLEKMMSAWGDESDIVCIQPLSKQVQGREAVSNSWKEVFSAGTNMEIEVHHQNWIEIDNIAIHVVHEQLIFNGDRRQMPPALIATNVYRQSEKGWRMVLHHASPPPPPPMPQATSMGTGMTPPPHFNI